MDQRADLIDWLVVQNTSFVWRWLQEVWRGDRTISEDFNWQHLAATFDVLAKGSWRPDLEWAKIAMAVYDYLIDRSEGMKKSFFADKKMELQAYCILHLGERPGDPLLDVRQVVARFFQTLPLSPEDAQNKIASLQNLSWEELVQLSQVMERLRMIKRLQKRDRLLPSEELKQWLAILEQWP